MRYQGPSARGKKFGVVFPPPAMPGMAPTLYCSASASKCFRWIKANGAGRTLLVFDFEFGGYTSPEGDFSPRDQVHDFYRWSVVSPR